MLFSLLTEKYKEEEDQIPSLGTLETKMRRDYQSFSKFLEWFVSCIICRENFRKNVTQQKVSMFVTVSDEVMALLILKNNYDLWCEIGQEYKTNGNKLKIEDCKSKQIYFSEGKGRGRSWSDEGKDYFNNMYKLLKQDRDENGEAFDNQYFEEQGMVRGIQTKRGCEKVQKAKKIEVMSDFSAGGMLFDKDEEMYF
jgi:hypothetical protein